MEIFCFDTMIMRLLAERKRGPGFLIHDSHLFDGVDERQVAAALSIGAASAAEFGYQYIVTLNSDDVAKIDPSIFDASSYILEPRLYDEQDTGGLFGFRFD